MRSFLLFLLPTLALAALPRSPLSQLQARQTSSSACVSSCSSASDLAGVNAVAACASTDLACACTNAASLSSGCLSCILTSEGLTAADLNTACASGSSASAGGGSVTMPMTPSLTGSGSTPSQSAGGSYCVTDCTTASDIVAVGKIEQCSNSDLSCLCTNASTLDAKCLTCWLNLVGLTPAQYAADCAAGSIVPSGGSSLTQTNPGPGASNTNTAGVAPTGGAGGSAGSAGVKEGMSWVLGGMGVVGAVVALL